MDPKNLAVLQRLKDLLAENPKPPPTRKGFSEESIKAIEEVARRNLEGNKPTRLPPKLIPRRCAECGASYALESQQDRPRWVCISCKRARKLRKRQEKEAKVAAQYEKATGTRVEKIQRAIDSAKERLSRTPDGAQAGLLLQIRELERLLLIERVHTISKIRQIRPRKVSGSYGSGRRTN